MFSIGALSRHTGVKIPTIRYYEQMGLLSHDGRTSGNQRRYSQGGLDRLGFIKHARDLGLSLKMVRELIGIDAADHAETHRLATDHLGGVQDRIARLMRLEAELVRILASCDGSQDHNCNILSAFADHSTCSDEH